MQSTKNCKILSFDINAVVNDKLVNAEHLHQHVNIVKCILHDTLEVLVFGFKINWNFKSEPYNKKNFPLGRQTHRPLQRWRLKCDVVQKLKNIEKIMLVKAPC